MDTLVAWYMYSCSKRDSFRAQFLPINEMLIQWTIMYQQQVKHWFKYLVNVNDNTCSSYLINTRVLVVVYLTNARKRGNMSGKGTWLTNDMYNAYLWAFKYCHLTRKHKFLALACKARYVGLIFGQSNNRELHCQELIYKKSMT